MEPPLFRVVLHEPEIPNNTGNIGRTCIATGCSLELIKPLGFDTSVKALRRAGLDYWPRLGVREHDSWADFVRTEGGDDALPPRIWMLTTKTSRPVWDAPINRGDVLLFGKETAGLPADILERYADRAITLPMLPTERSLNVATAVCAVVYEGIRQLAAAGSVRIAQDGRIEC
ncbi:MAG: tRNA (cytidine(34)-2'-O)-methyltransferase [Phycisphaerales bacterium]|nr:tRNA (cytidine(34)-2'-O)-methyltransferase [Phycisphaerales bacterium]